MQSGLPPHNHVRCIRLQTCYCDLHFGQCLVNIQGNMCICKINLLVPPFAVKINTPVSGRTTATKVRKQQLCSVILRAMSLSFVCTGVATSACVEDETCDHDFPMTRFLLQNVNNECKVNIGNICLKNLGTQRRGHNKTMLLA